MDSVYYKKLPHTSLEQRKECIERAEEYIQNHRWVNYETGEFYDNYPTVFKDGAKIQAGKAEKKLSNPNSQTSKLFNLLGDDAHFYTLNLADIHSSWGSYETIFDPAKVIKIKSHVERMIKGPYNAVLEICGFTGCHLHIISGKQTYKHLKAETKVYDEFGIVKYVSKSSFAFKDKYENPEEYKVMLGQYLYWKGMMGKRRLPKRSWTRLKSTQTRKNKK